jgi:hypothetical protein
MAYRYNIDASGGAFTALTIDDACTAATADRSLNKYAGPANNKWEEIIQDAAPDNDKLRLTASTNTSTSSREGYGRIMYKINGNTCEAILHVVQEGGQEEPHYIYITLTGNMSGRYSDYVTFVLSNGMSYQANYASTSGAFSDKRVKMDIPGDLTITGVSVTDSVVAHMGYPAQLVSGSDTYLKDNGRYTINVIN